MLGIAGCNKQSAPSSECGQSSAQRHGRLDLKIVEQVQIDQNGAEVKPEVGQRPADPAGDGKATCPPVSIAMAGALNGPDAALGINIKNGVQLAIDKHNAANPGCQVAVEAPSTPRVTRRRPPPSRRRSSTTRPSSAWSARRSPVRPRPPARCSTRPAWSPPPRRPPTSTLSEQGWKTFFRGLANDGVQGPSVANYMKNTLGDKKVCVVDDSTDYGTGLAQAVRETLGPVADSACNISVKKGDKDFSAAVTQVKGAVAGLGVLQRLLRRGGTVRPAAARRRRSPARSSAPTAPRTRSSSSRPARRPRTPSCPARAARPPAPFADEYTKKFGQAPGTYSTEGYDLGNDPAQGHRLRRRSPAPALLDFVKNYDGQGVARKYQWTDNGELTTTLIWIYKVQ